MNIKIIGALLIIVGCAGFGFSLAAAHKKEERFLQCLIRAIDMMICELEFRMTPLPQLVHLAGEEAGGQVGQVFFALSEKLEATSEADVPGCMKSIMHDFPSLPWRTLQNMEKLGHSLGRFALSGQVSGLRAIHLLCKRDLDSLALDRDARLRSYRTLGICAGVALVILFL